MELICFALNFFFNGLCTKTVIGEVMEELIRNPNLRISWRSSRKSLMYYFPAPLISGYISSGNNFVYCAFRVVILVLLLLLSGAELCHLCPLIVNGYVFKNSKNQ